MAETILTFDIVLKHIEDSRNSLQMSLQLVSFIYKISAYIIRFLILLMQNYFRCKLTTSR